MAIDTKLVWQDRTLQQFKQQQTSGDLKTSNTSIVFLSDGFIWTHGTFYDGRIPVETGVSTGDFSLTTSWIEIPKGLYSQFFTSSGSYLVQIEFGDLIYTGYIPYKENEYKSVLSSNGSFISDNSINTDCEIPLSLCGYDDGRGRLFLKIGKGTQRDTSEKDLSHPGDSERIATIKPSLFLCSDKNITDISGLTFKFKKLI